MMMDWISKNIKTIINLRLRAQFSLKIDVYYLQTDFKLGLFLNWALYKMHMIFVNPIIPPTYFYNLGL